MFKRRNKKLNEIHKSFNSLYIKDNTIGVVLGNILLRLLNGEVALSDINKDWIQKLLNTLNNDFDKLNKQLSDLSQ